MRVTWVKKNAIADIKLIISKLKQKNTLNINKFVPT